MRSEHTGWTNGRRLGTHPDTDEAAANCDAFERLLERRLEADGVERHVEHPATGDLGDLVRAALRVARVERVVGAELERAVEYRGLDVDGDDRHRADQPRQLHDVGADAADAPHADRLADTHLPVRTTAPNGVDTASARIAACSSGTLSGTLVSPTACATVYSAHAPS